MHFYVVNNQSSVDVSIQLYIYSFYNCHKIASAEEKSSVIPWHYFYGGRKNDNSIINPHYNKLYLLDLPLVNVLSV